MTYRNVALCVLLWADNERARSEGGGGSGVNVGMRGAPLLNTARKKIFTCPRHEASRPGRLVPRKDQPVVPQGQYRRSGDEKISFLSDKYPSPCLPQGR
jgi:hypothetical protein